VKAVYTGVIISVETIELGVGSQNLKRVHLALGGKVTEGADPPDADRSDGKMYIETRENAVAKLRLGSKFHVEVSDGEEAKLDELHDTYLRKLLAEARWQLSHEGHNEETSPNGNGYIGDFGDAGDLCRTLADALASLLGVPLMYEDEKS
jgi:hypothetical protein